MATLFIQYQLQSKPGTDLFQVFWQEAAKQCRQAGLVPLLQPVTPFGQPREGYTGHYRIEPEGSHPDPLRVWIVESVGGTALVLHMDRGHEKLLTKVQQRMGMLQGSTISLPYERQEDYFRAFFSACEVYEQMRRAHDLSGMSYGIHVFQAG